MTRLACLIAALLLVLALPARSQTFEAAVAALDAEGSAATEAAIAALVALGDPRTVPILQAMEAGDLYAVKADRRIVVGASVSRRELALTDAVTGAALGNVSTRDVDKLTANNRMRGIIRAALGRLAIADPDPAARLRAVEALARAQTPENAALLREALAGETDPAVQSAMSLAVAQAELASPDSAQRIAAIERLASVATPETRALLLRLLQEEPDEAVRVAAQAAIDAMEFRLAAAETALSIFQGVSLGSVLLLAAIGLAITFGVMGVINMAHGEMIMLGAYTTFVVQELFRAFLPDLVDYYLPVALPAAFLVAGAFGMALERGVIRFLYGRPLETLLATWGISLVMQQAVRLVFGAPNREVANPSWLTGGFEAFGGIVLTWNRIAIILFAAGVFIALLLALRYTGFGRSMRAVSQNRGMASAMGIRTGWIDALTFGLGSGIAGVAGVALSQIGNVSPNLGQAYIVDSFLAVVFGGVGSLWGVLVAATGIGVVNKFIEPFAGAVLAKIFVLVLVILFIQRRPRGLFALRGRAAEA